MRTLDTAQADQNIAEQARFMGTWLDDETLRDEFDAIIAAGWPAEQHHPHPRRPATPRLPAAARPPDTRWRRGPPPHRRRSCPPRRPPRQGTLTPAHPQRAADIPTASTTLTIGAVTNTAKHPVSHQLSTRPPTPQVGGRNPVRVPRREPAALTSVRKTHLRTTESAPRRRSRSK